MKVCSKCGVGRPLNEFWRKSQSQDGRCSICILCEKARRRPIKRERVKRPQSPAQIAREFRRTEWPKWLLPPVPYFRDRSPRPIHFCRDDA